MKIKDESGNIVAEINLQEGFSVADLVKNLSNKGSKSCFKDLLNIKESEDKKQIVFKFSDGEFYYDLPSKVIMKSNGTKIGDASLSRTKLNITTKMVKLGYYERNTFWLELIKKTEVTWIKTFFSFVDIWANQKHKKAGWVNTRIQNKRCKVQILNSDKLFFDSIESFSKIPEIQKLSEDNLIKLYDGLLENSSEFMRKGKVKQSAVSDDAIYLNLKKTKLDSWFFENCDKALSENYVENQTLTDQAGGYISCINSNLKSQFQYVFETYRGAITSSQVKLINGLIEMGYEPNRLIDYLFRDIYNQGLELCFSDGWSNKDSALQLLFDYASMNRDMKKDYEKYPRYLSTLHDITQKNYKIKEDEILNEKFQTVVEQMKENKIEYSDDEYSIVIPKSIKDLVDEGQNLSHCVASYYKRMANNETSVVFLRSKYSLDKSLVTVEVRDGIVVQAKGKSNTEPKEKEKQFIKKYSDYLNSIK